jgi:hypothetical protein
VTQQLRFLAALKRLQDWHADSVKARDYNAPAAGGGKPGHRVLLRQEYPGTRKAWDSWRHAPDDDEREAIIDYLDEEYRQLTRRPPMESYKDYWGKTRYRRVEAEA